MAAHWHGGTPERGFSMALGHLFDPRDAAGFLVVGRDAPGVQDVLSKVTSLVSTVPAVRPGALW
jgi:hypothetical protein